MIELHVFETPSPTPAATLLVAENAIRMEGNLSMIDLTMNVMSSRLGRPISFVEDPEEWARALPYALRTPYAYAHVIHDSESQAA